jgi:hypothetical protein
MMALLVGLVWLACYQFYSMLVAAEEAELKD